MVTTAHLTAAMDRLRVTLEGRKDAKALDLWAKFAAAALEGSQAANTGEAGGYNGIWCNPFFAVQASAPNAAKAEYQGKKGTWSDAFAVPELWVRFRLPTWQRGLFRRGGKVV